jgi:xanthine dehydrogenase YagS FAD-binding subunit
LAPALISLDAKISIITPQGEKTIPLANFYVLPKVNVRQENILTSDEVVREIRVPHPKSGEKSTYYKLKERGAWDFALLSAAVKGVVSGGIFKDIKIIVGGVAPVPWRLEKAENIIRGKAVTEELLRKAAREALKEARALKENKYKRDLLEVVISRAALLLV